MNVIVIDIFCAILALAGITIALKGAAAARRRPQFDGGNPAPATYVTRIVGVMMAAFALALGVMVTAFSLASR